MSRGLSVVLDSADAASNIDRGVNIGLQVALVVLLCVAVIRAGYDLWRLPGHGRA
jgi:hypothetical protein